MGYTCKICGDYNSCWCGGKMCKCGMNIGQIKIVDKFLNTYNIEDNDTLVTLVKERNSEQTILNTLGLTKIQTTKKINNKIKTIWD